MDPKRFAWFIISSSILMLGIDAYVLYSWQRFVRRIGWSPWISRTAWALCLIMAVLSPTVSFIRSNQSQMDNWVYYLYIATTVWYIPKVAIMLVLILRDIVRIIRWAALKVMTLIQKEDKPAVEEPVVEGRRAVLQTAAWSLASVPFIIVARGIDNTDNITIFRETVELPKLSPVFDGLKIAQLSDIHAGSWHDSAPFQEARRLIMQEHPDIIVITGDFVNFHPEELKLIRVELEKLQADMGVFASLGNHDHYMKPTDHELLQSVVRNSGIQLLVNESHVFNRGGERLQLSAIDNTGLGQNFGDLPRALVGTHTEFPTILMAHDPTFWDREVRGKREIELMLSGHTHGGQVGMRILGQELSVAQLVYKQWAGMYRDKDQLLYVNRGLGTIGPPLRIGIPPEITMFTLKPRATLLG